MDYKETLEDYGLLIKNLRSLKENIYKRYLILESKNISSEDRFRLIAENKKDEIEYGNLREVKVFKPRVFDVYISAVEIAEKKFIDEYPEPIKYQLCSHVNGTDFRKIFHADNSVHLINQCRACGGIVGYVKKPLINDMAQIPVYDSEFYDKWLYENCAHHRWNQKRYEVAKAARFKGGDSLPEFDYGNFDYLYRQEFPEPFHSGNCLHSRSEPRYRRYEKSDCVVLQCLDCGKHLKALKKSEFRGYSSLPLFDEDRENSVYVKYMSWITAKGAAQKSAQAEFFKDAKTKIMLGEIEINDNSKYATYYNSAEWFKTRRRIFSRDNFKCRNSNCGRDATCVHHIIYDRLGEEHDFDLISLCHECHEYVHSLQDSIPYFYKITPTEIDSLMDAHSKLANLSESNMSIE